MKYKNTLAISYEKLGETHSKLGNWFKALVYFEKRNQLGEELYKSYPENESYKEGLTISYSKLGSTHMELDNLSDAFTYLEKDLQFSAELYSSYPANVSYKNRLALSHSKLGMLHILQNNFPEAKPAFELCCKIYNELYQQVPSSIDYRSNYAESLAVSAALRQLEGIDAKAELTTAKQHFEGLYQIINRDDFKRKAALITQMRQTEGEALRDLILAISKF